MKKNQAPKPKKSPQIPLVRTISAISPEKIVSQEEARTKKILRRTATIGVFLSLCSFFLYLQISNYSRSCQENQSKLSTLQNQDQNIFTLKQDYDSVKKQAQIITASLPSKENIIEFVSSLETIALDNNFNTQLSFGKGEPQKDPQGLTFVPFQIVFTGSIENLASYLNQIEKLPYFVKISKITSQNLKGLQGEGQYSLEASLYIFK